MMYNYPYGIYRPYYPRYDRYVLKPYNPTEKCTSGNKEETKTSVNNDEKEPPNTDAPIFDFLGIHLYSDDLLIIAILFFLYFEGVKDPELFIAMILLLLS